MQNNKPGTKKTNLSDEEIFEPIHSLEKLSTYFGGSSSTLDNDQKCGPESCPTKIDN